MRSAALGGVLIYILGLSASAWTARAETLGLGPSKDNTLYEDPDGLLSNGAGQYFFSGRTGIFNNTLRRGLIAFDVSAVPTGATIVSVSLTLNLSITISGPTPMNLHRVTANWGEGLSDTPGEEGGGSPAMPGDATWQHTFFDTDFWTTDGGDFAPAGSAMQSVSGVGFYTWSSPGMIADVVDWLANPATNFGWVLIGDEVTIGSAKRFDTRENPNTANRPVLTICFVPADCTNCDGDLDGNDLADGADIGGFVACFLSGEPASPGCACADMNFDAAFSEADITEFVAKLLAGAVCCN